MSVLIYCLAALEKIAFGPEEMGKVLKNFKSIQVKSPAMNQFMGGVGGKKGVREALNAARRVGAPEEVLQEAMPQIREQFAHLRPHGPTTFTPVKGDAIGFLKSHGVTEDAFQGLGSMGLPGVHPESLQQVSQNPSSRRALDAVFKGHELAETQVKPSASFTAFGHRSPDVILREHNMIQTLPREHEPVANLMRTMRAPGEATVLKQTTGFNYGEGPRISRHARKHLVNLHEQEAMRMAKERGSL